MKRRPPLDRTTGVHPLLGQAVVMHQEGRIAEATKIYQTIIAEVPKHFDATHLLGVIALQQGRLDEARSLITAALLSNPKDPAAAIGRITR